MFALSLLVFCAIGIQAFYYMDDQGGGIYYESPKETQDSNSSWTPTNGVGAHNNTLWVQPPYIY
jgi:hypothetical protein